MLAAPLHWFHQAVPPAVASLYVRCPLATVATNRTCQAPLQMASRHWRVADPARASTSAKLTTPGYRRAISAEFWAQVDCSRLWCAAHPAAASSRRASLFAGQVRATAGRVAGTLPG